MRSDPTLSSVMIGCGGFHDASTEDTRVAGVSVGSVMNDTAYMCAVCQSGDLTCIRTMLVCLIMGVSLTGRVLFT